MAALHPARAALRGRREVHGGAVIFQRRPRSFADIERRCREGIDFVRAAEDRGSAILIAAPHGGGIEPGTSEIARALAGRTLSHYTFEGIRPGGNGFLHLTSTLFDDPHFLGLAARARVVVSVHGSGGRVPGVFAGGRHEALKTAAIEALQASGFPAERDSDERSGADPRNLCNRGTSGEGLQLEISLGLRRAERESTTTLFERFVEAMEGVLQGTRGTTA